MDFLSSYYFRAWISELLMASYQQCLNWEVVRGEKYRHTVHWYITFSIFSFHILSFLSVYELNYGWSEAISQASVWSERTTEVNTIWFESIEMSPEPDTGQVTAGDTFTDKPRDGSAAYLLRWSLCFHQPPKLFLWKFTIIFLKTCNQSLLTFLFSLTCFSIALSDFSM